MVKIVMLSITILVIVLGMSVLIKELQFHFNNRKRISSGSLRWKTLLLLVGVCILYDKVQMLSSSL